MIPNDLLSVGVVVRDAKDNPWLDRLLTSLDDVPCGFLKPPVLVEEGADLSKVEKKIRVLQGCKTRYLLMLEDDTEVLTPGWATAMINSFQIFPRTGLAGPAEVTAEPTAQQVIPYLKNEVCEAANLGGFCQLLDTTFPICWDVRIQMLDDLYLSLLTRSRGYRIIKTFACIVRHTKLPWAPDGTPPWEQKDRTRFGEKDAYYEKERHNLKRLSEGKLLLEMFGDLARQTLPPELLAVLEPERVPTGLSQPRPSCTKCRNPISPDADYVMVRSSFPVCVLCFEKGGN